MTHPLTAVLRQWAAANKFPTWGAAIRWLRAHDMMAAADRPTFHSVDDCLRFAFNAEIPTVKTTGAFKLAGRARDDLWDDEDDKKRAKAAPVRTRDPDIDRRPTGIDAVTQQNMILNFVRRLPIPDHLYICAKYARGDERRAARRALRDVLLPRLGQITRPRYAVYVLIGAHFGKRVDRDELAGRFEHLFPAKLAASDAKSLIRRLANEIDSLLKDFAASAEEKCYTYFQHGGLIK